MLTGLLKNSTCSLFPLKSPVMKHQRMHKFCYIHNPIMQPHSDNGIHHLLHSYVSFKRYLYQASMFGLSPSNSCLSFRTQFQSHFFPRNLPRPSLPLLPIGCFGMLLFYAFTVPSASLYFNTCYTVRSQRVRHE